MPSEHPLDANSAINNPSLELSVPSSTSSSQQMPVSELGIKKFVDIAAVSELSGDIDLLGISDDLGVADSSRPGLMLDSTFVMSSDDYQAGWNSIDDIHAFTSTIFLSTQPTSTESVENALIQASLKTMASGDLPSELKFFLYSKDTLQDCVMMIQLSISKDSPEIIVTSVIKLSREESREYYFRITDHLKVALARFT
jgi:hypothetical protein